MSDSNIEKRRGKNEENDDEDDKIEGEKKTRQDDLSRVNDGDASFVFFLFVLYRSSLCVERVIVAFQVGLFNTSCLPCSVFKANRRIKQVIAVIYRVMLLFWCEKTQASIRCSKKAKERTAKGEKEKEGRERRCRLLTPTLPLSLMRRLHRRRQRTQTRANTRQRGRETRERERVVLFNK